MSRKLSIVVTIAVLSALLASDAEANNNKRRGGKANVRFSSGGFNRNRGISNNRSRRNFVHNKHVGGHYQQFNHRKFSHNGHNNFKHNNFKHNNFKHNNFKHNNFKHNNFKHNNSKHHNFKHKNFKHKNLHHNGFHANQWHHNRRHLPHWRFDSRHMKTVVWGYGFPYQVAWNHGKYWVYYDGVWMPYSYLIKYHAGAKQWHQQNYRFLQHDF